MDHETGSKEFDPSLPSPGLGRGQGRGRTTIQIISNTAIGISPARLDFSLNRGEEATQRIFLQNFDPSPTKVSLILQNPKYDQRISINPSELILPPDEVQEVEITVVPKKNLSTEIQIQELARTQGALAVASGVKLPLKVEIEGTLVNWYLFLAVGLAAVATATAYFFKKRKS